MSIQEICGAAIVTCGLIFACIGFAVLMNAFFELLISWATKKPTDKNKPAEGMTVNVDYEHYNRNISKWFGIAEHNGVFVVVELVGVVDGKKKWNLIDLCLSRNEAINKIETARSNP